MAGGDAASAHHDDVFRRTTLDQSAEFGGQLKLAGTIDSPVAIGAFTMRRGRIELLGKRFNLTSGRLTFAELGYNATDRLSIYVGATVTHGSASSSLTRSLDRAAYLTFELNC